ncbi:MAG: hypothetical protein AAF481_06105 [Acidobacteriota bacterium]
MIGARSALTFLSAVALAGTLAACETSSREENPPPVEANRPSEATATGRSLAPPIRGITVSTHRDGQDWGNYEIGPTFDELKDLGTNWVATHPYGWIRADGSVRFRSFDPENPPAHLTRPIREAHARGLKILIKPHLGYWRSPFRWRGDITFEDDASWERFWTTYEAWITAIARASSGADAFVVGVELDRTLDHEARWREVIAAVRREIDAPLTYAANWPDFERVGFWDALDLIGIQAYFPILEGPFRPGPTPPLADLDAGWRRVMARLRTFADERERDILFTELGYNRSLTAPVRPWEYATDDGPEAEAVQQAALRAALAAVEEEPRVVGSFLWKWFPIPHQVGRDFQLATPVMRRAIADSWSDDSGAPIPGAPGE